MRNRVGEAAAAHVWSSMATLLTAVFAFAPLHVPIRRMASSPRTRKPVAVADDRASLVLLTGFEQFNRGLYACAVDSVSGELDVQLFTDKDIGSDELDAALSKADVFFASLVFDYDQVAWLTPRLERVPTRFIFESALELMSSTKVRSFTMAGGGAGASCRDYYEI